MILEQLKGDIFDVGYSGNYQFMLIFGHLGGLGINIMNFSWQFFKNRHDEYENTEDPFVEFASPSQLNNGTWIHCIEAKQDLHRMDDATLENTFSHAFQWAIKNNITEIITNGIRDIRIGDYDDFSNWEENTKRTLNRIKFIREICSREEYDRLNISLISMNDSYLKTIL